MRPKHGFIPTAITERESFLKAVRWFCSNLKEEMGNLVTPQRYGNQGAGRFRRKGARRRSYSMYFATPKG